MIRINGSLLYFHRLKKSQNLKSELALFLNFLSQISWKWRLFSKILIKKKSKASYLNTFLVEPFQKGGLTENAVVLPPPQKVQALTKLLYRGLNLTKWGYGPHPIKFAEILCNSSKFGVKLGRSYEKIFEKYVAQLILYFPKWNSNFEEEWNILNFFILNFNVIFLGLLIFFFQISIVNYFFLKYTNQFFLIYFCCRWVEICYFHNITINTYYVPTNRSQTVSTNLA